MAFTTTRTATFSLSRSKRMSVGTFTNTSNSSGGTVVTGLKAVDTFVWACSSHMGTEVPKVTKNSPSGGSVVVVTSDNVIGDWMAIGI